MHTAGMHVSGMHVTKVVFSVLGIVLLVLAAIAAVRFFLERRRQEKAQADGVVVYATVLRTEAVGGLIGKLQPMITIFLRLQEPGASTSREVAIRTRLEAGAKIGPEMRVPVVIDPKDPKRIYPASPEAAKRAVVTGSRVERRQMQSQLRSPARGQRRAQGGGYQPPPMRRG